MVTKAELKRHNTKEDCWVSLVSRTSRRGGRQVGRLAGRQALMCTSVM
jgi:hypothetical protein